MVRQHHWLNEHELEPSPGESEGQRSLVCCSPWGHKELDTTERLDDKTACVRTRMREHQKMKAGGLFVAGSWVFCHTFIRHCYAIKINWKHFQVHSWAPHVKNLYFKTKRSSTPLISELVSAPQGSFFQWPSWADTANRASEISVRENTKRLQILSLPSAGGFPGGSAGKESPCNAGDLGLTPGMGRSPGGGHGNPLQYSCLEIPHGQRNLVGYSPWGHKESDVTEVT